MTNHIKGGYVDLFSGHENGTVITDLSGHDFQRIYSTDLSCSVHLVLSMAKNRTRLVSIYTKVIISLSKYKGKKGE